MLTIAEVFEVTDFSVLLQRCIMDIEHKNKEIQWQSFIDFHSALVFFLYCVEGLLGKLGHIKDLLQLVGGSSHFLLLMDKFK